MEYGVRLVGWDSKIGIRYEICEKIRLKKNSISSLKLVVCGEIWFHSFYNFLPFFHFLLLLCWFIFTGDIHLTFFFLSLHFFFLLLVRSTVLYYKYSSKCVMLPCFQHYRQEHFATVRVFKKRSFFLTYIYPQYIQYIIHVRYDFYI